MAELPLHSPEDLGLDSKRLERAHALLEGWTRTGKMPAAGLCVGRGGGAVAPRFFGRQRVRVEDPLRQDSLFLVASITKPITATAIMILVERGALALDDRVAEYVPAFAANGKGDVRIRHLLTHTSGLPDMLPENDRLRAAHEPLRIFIDAICRQPLLFEPGTQVSYQSMGFAMLAEVVHQVAGMLLPEFLEREVFAPLGMKDTSLGWHYERRERIAEVRLTHTQLTNDWHWNSPYWLSFGAPWGGLITSPSDLARFCLMMLGQGSLEGARVLAPATVQAMTSNQLDGLPKLPEEERRAQPWGLGWRLNGQARSAPFGNLLSPRAYGHTGSTGTLCWVDPDTGAFLVLLTTQPQGDERHQLLCASNAFTAALV